MNPAFKKRAGSFATKAIHIAQEPEQWNGLSVIPPIFLSTTYKQQAPGKNKGYFYSRCGNPSRNVLEKCLASLDNANYGLTFASGMGAITTMLTMLSSGDHIVMGDDVYGGTNRLVRTVANRLHIDTTFVDLTDLIATKAAFKPNTKLVWTESPTNPLTKVVDIVGLCKLAHQMGKIIVAVDNTFLTSYFQRPLELGADIVCYSLTKYMNGHSDVVMGALIMNSQNLYDTLKSLQMDTGIVPSPFDCYLVNRSLKTLAVRMEQHQKNSIAVAMFLENHPFVEKVLHPALPSHPQHQIALKQTYGYSSVFSFYIKGELEHAKAFFRALKLFTLAVSLGGYESLAELPSMMTHANVPLDERKKLGITDSLIRLSVGLEDVEDLIADLNDALNAAVCL